MSTSNLVAVPATTVKVLEAALVVTAGVVDTAWTTCVVPEVRAVADTESFTPAESAPDDTDPDHAVEVSVTEPVNDVTVLPPAS